MKTKIIATLVAALGLVGTASATTVIGKKDVNWTDTQALIDFSLPGSFSFGMSITPTTLDKIKLTFAAPTSGTFSNLTASFYSSTKIENSSTLLYTFNLGTMTPTGGSKTFNDATYAINKFPQLSAGTTYGLVLAGSEVIKTGLKSDQFKITVSQGTIAAVPEPESYAMLLAGLGLIGTMVRRRKVK